MDDLPTLLEAADGAPVSSLGDAELSARLLALTDAIDRLTALRRTVAGEWDRRLVWAGDGARSGAAWLAHNSEVSRGRAGAELRVAKRLRTMEHLAAASEAGELGAEKVAALTHAVDRDHNGALAGLFARDEAQLVDAAKALNVDQTRAAVRYWRHCADDVTATADPQAQYDAMGLRLVRGFDGMFDLSGRLDPVSGEMLTNRLDEVAEQLYNAERATLAEGETGRTPSQRRADALIELLSRAPSATSDEDDPHRALPLLLIDVPLEALEDRSGKPATLPDGTPVAFETISRLACEAGIAAILTRAGRLTTDLGRASYTPNRGQRRALAKRDRGCVFPGCDRPAGWCDTHHLWPWEHGGPTALWNLGLLCRYHHHLVHEGGFRLVADAGGAIHAYRPDGSEIHAPPGRATHRIDPRPPGVEVPPQWSSPSNTSRGSPPGMTASGTAPPGGWDANHPPDPALDELAYRRWQDHLVRKRLGLAA